MKLLSHSGCGSGPHALARGSSLIGAAILPFIFFGQLASQPGAAVMETLRERALDNLRALPNYTCTSTIERSSRRSLSHRFENIDRIRLEIAYVGGRELFGWPAGERIADEDLRRFVGGTITNGDFALLTRALFAGPGISFRNINRKDSSGRQVLSGEFTATREGSDWTLVVGQREEPVAYYGSFRADPESLRLISLAMMAEHIPREFGYRRITRDLEFQPVRIGSDEFLLPSRAELVTLDKNGEETRNETSFANCRQFTAESAVRFEAPEEETTERVANEVSGGLPDAFEASCELESQVDSDVSAIGDPITARLSRSIAGKGGLEIPKGAILHGRIRQLNVVDGRRRSADFAFGFFEWNGKRVEIGSRSNQLIVMEQHITGMQNSGTLPMSPMSPAVATVSTHEIRADGRHLVIPHGFQFRLESKANSQ